MKNSGYFIVATDTGVGKTLISAWLMLHLDADYWKPLNSGSEYDTNTVKDLTRLPPDRFHKEAHLLTSPLSIHEAARRDGIAIKLQDLIPPSTHRPLIIESAGGIMSPLNEQDQTTTLDQIDHFGLPTILVARTTLGTLSQTLCAIDVMSHRNIKPTAIILSGPYHPSNAQALRGWKGCPPIIEFPQIGELSCQTLQSIPLPLGL